MRFELVISDMAMPNMTGIQLAQEVRKIRQNIPILICTGFSENVDEKIMSNSGIKGLLMKPVARIEMARMVRKIIDEFNNQTQQ